MSTEMLEETKTKKKKHRGTWLLILLLLVLILFLLSTILVGSQLHLLVSRDKYTVDMDMESPNGAVDLFRVEYANEEGQITVHGTNGENVVAPGTAINYDLRLRNHDEGVIDFVMVPSVEFFTEDAVPVEFKILDTYGNYILGSETRWASAEEMSALVHKGSIQPSEVYTYHISWQWAFEVDSQQNLEDTRLGSHGGVNPPGLAVKIETQASANPAPAKSPAHMMHLRGEGFGCCWCCWLVWLLILICLILLIWIWRQNRKLNEQNDTLEEYETVLKAYGLLKDGELVKGRHG